MILAVVLLGYDTTNEATFHTICTLPPVLVVELILYTKVRRCLGFVYGLATYVAGVAEVSRRPVANDEFMIMHYV